MRVGVIGGGQLARMMVPPAIELGIELRVLAEIEGSSAAIAATAVGDYRDAATVLAFARDVDVVTFDHEHVPQPVLAELVAAGIAVRPGPAALAVAQDKLHMRERLTALGAPVPAWAAVHDAAELGDFLDAHGGSGGREDPARRIRRQGRPRRARRRWRRRLVRRDRRARDRRRAARRGARRLPSRARAARRPPPIGRGRRLAARRDGAARRRVRRGVRAGARVPVRCRRRRASSPPSIATGLDVTGVLAVELFETADGRLLVNELAMRPHNTGHWTIDGAVTSQFEQHLRAVLDLPLGDPSPLAPWSVMVNVLGGPAGETMPDRYPSALAAEPGVKFHSYGKQSRPGRKVGHVTAIGDDLDDVRRRARAAAGFFQN